MNFEWKQVKLPNFGVPKEKPNIPMEIYETRIKNLYQKANKKWVLVYGDREHFANLHYLTEFDPRFEEALLILGPNDKKYLLVGNEGWMYQPVIKPDVEVVLFQTFSLMGQDRTKSARLDEVLTDIGISKGDDIGICGWKYLEESEKSDYDHYFVPSYIVGCLKSVIGSSDGLSDTSSVLMHPTKGLRAYNEVEQIAVFEWAASRASKALLRIVTASTPHITELEAVSQMRYAGEPLTTYVMYASGQKEIVGLRSPSEKLLEKGDGIFTALGYRGGLSARGGLLETVNDSFVKEWAIPYYRGIVTWYENARIGADGAEIYDLVTESMAKGNLRPALNPGHLTSSDEWLHTFFQPNSKEKITSGMAIQCDIIPEPMPDGIVLNCEDSVFFADEDLRNQIANKYPEMWKRIQKRQAFMRNELGINISDELLPFSTTPGYYAPLFMSPDYCLTKS